MHIMHPHFSSEHEIKASGIERYLPPQGHSLELIISPLKTQYSHIYKKFPYSYYEKRQDRFAKFYKAGLFIFFFKHIPT